MSAGEIRLHDLRLAAGEWWACSEPERQGDGLAVFDERCSACRLKGYAEIARVGDHAVVNIEDGRVAFDGGLGRGRVGMSGDVVRLDGDRHESALCEKRGQFQEVCGCGWRSSWTTDAAAATEYEVHVAGEKLWARLTEPQHRALDALVVADDWITGRTQQGSATNHVGNYRRLVVNTGAARRLTDNGYAEAEWLGAYRFRATERGRDIHPLTRCSARHGGKPCGYCHACRRRLPQPESLACPHCGASDWDE